MNGVLDDSPEAKEVRTAKGLLEIGKFYQGLGTYRGEGLATLVEDGKILAIPEYHIFELRTNWLIQRLALFLLWGLHR